MWVRVEESGVRSRKITPTWSVRASSPSSLSLSLSLIGSFVPFFSRGGGRNQNLLSDVEKKMTT